MVCRRLQPRLRNYKTKIQLSEWAFSQADAHLLLTRCDKEQENSNCKALFKRCIIKKPLLKPIFSDDKPD
jgi:hypothetical protein